MGTEGVEWPALGQAFRDISLTANRQRGDGRGIKNLVRRWKTESNVDLLLGAKTCASYEKKNGPRQGGREEGEVQQRHARVYLLALLQRRNRTPCGAAPTGRWERGTKPLRRYIRESRP